MAINLYNVKVWFNMLKGNSVHHVNQTLGLAFEKDEIRGYFNNMTEKVLKDPDDSIAKASLPIDHEACGDVLFPVGIFQYGLGAYDLFLLKDEKKYLDQFKLCVDWTLENQEESGAWNNFFFRYPQNPYGAMCQGEAVSLLVRAYTAFEDDKYLIAAKKAISFMLIKTSEGGTTEYDGDEIILMEYTHLPVVLNGWIFSAFGLYDLYLATKELEYKLLFDNTVNAIKKRLHLFDNGYWSMYDLGGKLTSPFYHNLHIAQMQALYIVTDDEIFDITANKWEQYKTNSVNRKRAFIHKALQKIIEK